MFRARITAFAVFALAAVSACDRTSPSLGASTAHADPTTASSAPSVFPQEKIDTLLLSLDEANKALAPLDRPFFSVDPARKRPDDLQSAGSTACGAAVTVGTQDSVGRDWVAYRSELYVGEQNTMVELVVAVYKDGSAAEGSFASIASAAKSCKPNSELAVESTTGEAVRLRATVGWDAEVRLVDNVLVQVKAAGTDKDGPAAHILSGLISRRIRER